MERDLYKYFLNLRERNIPVSGLMLQEKAKALQRAIDVNSSFNASNGWLNRFKKRYGIRLLQISGEKLSSQPELVDPFKEALRSTIERLDLTSEQIYNSDEAALYWKLLPSKTYVSETEKTAPGRKISKQRITILACTNAAGNHKLKPLVLEKSKNPRAFRNFNLPVNYRSSKTAWMTMNIFREWFHSMFIPEVKAFLMSRNLPVKALLLLDNAPSHPPEAELKSPDGLITVLFMPPNVTPLIQPMDQNVIRITKLFYRKNLLSQLLSKGSDLSAILQTYTLRDALSNLALAWNMLKPIVIEKCWRNILTINLDDKDDNVPLSVLIVKLLNDEAHNANQHIIDL